MTSIQILVRKIDNGYLLQASSLKSPVEEAEDLTLFCNSSDEVVKRVNTFLSKMHTNQTISVPASEGEAA